MLALIPGPEFVKSEMNGYALLMAANPDAKKGTKNALISHLKGICQNETKAASPFSIKFVESWIS